MASNESVVQFQIDGKTYDLDVESLTFGEVEILEDETGKPFGDLDFDSAKALMVLAYLARRRKEPLFSLEEMRALPITAVQPVEESPTSAGTTGEVADDDSGSQSSQ